MVTITEKIREISRNLLDKEKVDFVVGFREGSLPMMVEPFRARTATFTSQFVWNSACRLNLANYLLNQDERIGVVAKGCDSRSIVNHIVEGKIKRDQLYIIGVPCSGMVDDLRLKEIYGGEIQSVQEDTNDLIIEGANGTRRIQKKRVLRHNCQTCHYPNPVIYDELVADSIEHTALSDVYKDVQAVDTLSPDEKNAFFDELYANCVRCYACRNACPLCYCPTCFVDESNPQWLGKSDDLTDRKTFHFLRAFHCAGRCVDCGACESACPQDIPVRILTRKLMKECQDDYQWEAGLTTDQRPPLDTFKTDDPQAFIK